MELDNIEMARQIVSHYTQNPPNIRQRNVYVQYSNHKELKTDSSPAQQVTHDDPISLSEVKGRLCVPSIISSQSSIWK